MRYQDPALSYEGAINEYFGGIEGLSKQSLPFTCKCGGTTFVFIDEDKKKFDRSIMSVADCFAHIRRTHRERIKKEKKVKEVEK